MTLAGSGAAAGPGAVVITGASSGLGAALARSYAAPGRVLGLVGRDAPRLDAVADACRALGAEVRTAVLDVAEPEPLQQWLDAFDAAHPVDLVIANAGTSGGPAPEAAGEGAELAGRQVRTNLIGAFNTIEPLLPALVARGRGAIGVVASIAAYRGHPDSPAYSASKAGLRAYGEALRARLGPRGLTVTVICPGFFDTPMTQRFRGSKPGMLSLERAAEAVRRGLDRGAARVVFPRGLVFGMQVSDLLPGRLGDRLVRLSRFHIVRG